MRSFIAVLSLGFSVSGVTAFAGSFTSVNLFIHSDLGGTVGACDLGATLLIPSQGTPSALVIFGAGSGPNDRDEHQGGSNLYPFKNIAETLSSAGVATLRFDKRESIPSCQPPIVNNPDLPYPTIEDFKNVVRYTKTNSTISNLPLILLGHSSGVTDVLAVANSGEFAVSNLILMAGLGIYSVDQELIRQFQAIITAPGLPSTQENAYQTELTAAELFFGKIHKGTAQRTDEFMSLYTKYWSDWIKITSQDSQMASSLKTPTLLLQGDDDTNITREDFEALSSAIEPVHGSQSELLTRLDHDFFSPGETQVDPRVSASILNWLSRRNSSVASKPSLRDKTKTIEADVISKIDSVYKELSYE